MFKKKNRKYLIMVAVAIVGVIIFKMKKKTSNESIGNTAQEQTQTLQQQLVGLGTDAVTSAITQGASNLV